MSVAERRWAVGAVVELQKLRAENDALKAALGRARQQLAASGSALVGERMENARLERENAELRAGRTPRLPR